MHTYLGNQPHGGNEMKRRYSQTSPISTGLNLTNHQFRASCQHFLWGTARPGVFATHMGRHHKTKRCLESCLVPSPLLTRPYDEPWDPSPQPPPTSDIRHPTFGAETAGLTLTALPKLPFDGAASWTKRIYTYTRAGPTATEYRNAVNFLKPVNTSCVQRREGPRCPWCPPILGLPRARPCYQSTMWASCISVLPMIVYGFAAGVCVDVAGVLLVRRRVLPTHACLSFPGSLCL